MDLHGDMKPAKTSRSYEEGTKMLLQYLYTNPEGAIIYLDTYNLHYVQEDLGKTNYLEQVEAYFRGDRYYDEYRIAYLRARFPRIVDPMGMTGTKESIDEGIERPPLENDVRARFISIKELNRIIVDNPKTRLYQVITLSGSLYYMREDVHPQRNL